MTDTEQIRALLMMCSEEHRREIFAYLRETIPIHPFEKTMGASAEAILEALARADDLNIRGVRGMIAEATFAMRGVEGWRDVTPPVHPSYDTALTDGLGVIRVQVKLQRRRQGKPWLRNGVGVVEVQKTRKGEKDGRSTRPYSFGEFDILAACLEPSDGRWDSFLFIPGHWLLARSDDNKVVDKHQPLPLKSDYVWTADFSEAVSRFRSGLPRPVYSDAHEEEKLNSPDRLALIDRVCQQLYSTPVSTAAARLPEGRGGAPAKAGFYAWWVVPGSLPQVPGKRHPAAPYDLLYVGISPKRVSSSGKIRSRTLQNHLSGNTGSSTFRYSLAALLLATEGFRPIRSDKKFLLPTEENRRLSQWQTENLALTWCECEEPWDIEPAVIHRLEPPLNLAENVAHPYHQTMSLARAAFRTASTLGTL